MNITSRAPPCLAHTRGGNSRIAEEGALALYIWSTGTPLESVGLSKGIVRHA